MTALATIVRSCWSFQPHRTATRRARAYSSFAASTTISPIGEQVPAGLHDDSDRRVDHYGPASLGKGTAKWVAGRSLGRDRVTPPPVPERRGGAGCKDHVPLACHWAGQKGSTGTGAGRRSRAVTHGVDLGPKLGMRVRFSSSAPGLVRRRPVVSLASRWRADFGRRVEG